MSNYATQFDFKNAASVDNSDFAKAADLSSLKSDIEELDIDKVKYDAHDFYKPSNFVENEVVTQTVYDELVKKVNAIQTIDTRDFFLKSWLWRENWWNWKR